MAKIEFKGIDEYSELLAKLADKRAVEGIIKYAAYDGAAIAIEAIKANTPVDTGSLRDSAKLTRFVDDNGFVHTTVIFDGYDENGHPNPVKARVFESGSSTRQKHPFIRPAINQCKNEVIAAMRNGLDEKLKEITKG